MVDMRKWPLRGRVWPMALLAGAVVGAVLMAPFGREIRDGGFDCTSCGTYTVTLIGVKVREMYAGLLPVIGAVFGLLAGFVLSLAWSLIRNHHSGPPS
jgi:hypothetical protein